MKKLLFILGVILTITSCTKVEEAPEETTTETTTTVEEEEPATADVIFLVQPNPNSYYMDLMVGDTPGGTWENQGVLVDDCTSLARIKLNLIVGQIYRAASYTTAGTYLGMLTFKLTVTTTQSGSSAPYLQKLSNDIGNPQLSTCDGTETITFLY